MYCIHIFDILGYNKLEDARDKTIDNALLESYPHPSYIAYSKWKTTTQHHYIHLACSYFDAANIDWYWYEFDSKQNFTHFASQMSAHSLHMHHKFQGEVRKNITRSTRAIILFCLCEIILCFCCTIIFHWFYCSESKFLWLKRVSYGYERHELERCRRQKHYSVQASNRNDT